jgi:sugar-specific transcriptional regulator TrmB
MSSSLRITIKKHKPNNIIMHEKVLEKAGLTKNEVKVYLSLLRRGLSTAGSLVKESGLHRSRVYESLEMLAQKGLVGYCIKDFKKHFQVAKPEVLLDFLEEKKRIIEENKKEIREILPKLKEMESIKKEEIEGAVFKGREGLKAIHSDMLKQGEDVWVLGAKGLIFTELKYFIQGFERDRVKKGMKWKSIFDRHENFNRIKKPLFEKRRMPDEFASSGVVNIYGDRVAIVLWKEKYPTGFLIINKLIADAFRKWFSFMYGKCEGE